MITLRIVSRLLDYPDEALFTHYPDLIAALEEAIAAAAARTTGESA